MSSNQAAVPKRHLEAWIHKARIERVAHPLVDDWCKSITVEGRVESVEYENPHSIIVARQDDGTAYTVDWLPMDGLTRNRILESAKGALAFGARVSVTRCTHPTRRRYPRVLPRLQGRGEPEND